MTFKIYKNAKMKNPRHDEGQSYLTHDGIVIYIIRKMRKMNFNLVYYLETTDMSPTEMKFEEVTKYVQNRFD